MSIQTIAIHSERKMNALFKPGPISSKKIRYQQTPEELVADTLRIQEGTITSTGALAIRTGQFTGRSPKDKFIVRDETANASVNWNEFNTPLEPEYFDVIYSNVMNYLNDANEVWVRDCYACADRDYGINIRVISEKPWSDLFAYNMFLRPTEEELKEFSSEWFVIHVPGLKLNAGECGVRHENASVISFSHKMIIVAGTGYTGEIKKGIFSILNFTLPREHDVLSMHCSANMGKEGDTAIFFGLSGTGKTTLSADPSRMLIGDDEHGWTDHNIFNFEGGCYAKCVNLTEEKEPEIYKAIRSGALAENIQFFPGTNKINFGDISITENTRVSYPLPYISNAKSPSTGCLPKNIFFLTCDAFGVLPPISRLTPDQAMYQFISGYTAKVAGTETGVNEPKPTFSACFGAPFLPLHPGKYASMLGERMQRNNVKVWLVNTGWVGGPYGTGHRISLTFTRAIINAVLENLLDHVEYEKFPVFGFSIPKTCAGVPADVLSPQNTWQDREAYNAKLKYLAGLFSMNFEKYAAGVSENILLASPSC